MFKRCVDVLITYEGYHGMVSSSSDEILVTCKTYVILVKLIPVPQVMEYYACWVVMVRQCHQIAIGFIF